MSDELLNNRTAKAIRVHVDSKGQLELFPEGKVNDLFMQQKLEGMVHEEMSVYGAKEEESQVIQRSKEEILEKTKGSHRGFFDDSERFAIVKKYADRYHFFHPMLEFLEVFWLRDGFDIICGNPPWIKLEFDEVGVISEKYPEVAIRKMSAAEVHKKYKNLAYTNFKLKKIYRAEQIEDACTGVFLNAYQNYPLLVGQQPDLYKCVIENGFTLLSDKGYMGLLHPESVYEDAYGQPLRKEIYSRLCYHFQFENELNLFTGTNDHGRMKFGENIYRGIHGLVGFYNMNNVFHPNTIDMSFIHDGQGTCLGIKDNNGNWNTHAHKDRIV
ncbi:MAG: hypothetical protein K5656_02855, partial [Lachnospiraceae bacterium]|nr:hypothetical protein [Lachnospiraceae bacterium]